MSKQDFMGQGQGDAKDLGLVVYGTEDTPGQKAYFIHLESKPGKEAMVEKFLHDIHAGVDKEPGTGPWFATRLSQTTFAIFEAFDDSAARHAHDAGPGGQNFLAPGKNKLLDEMLAYPAQLYRLDILHGKFGTLFGKPVTTTT